MASSSPHVAVVLFTRDLRLHDNPALVAALREADQVVPLFVLDEKILRGPFNRPNRATFLAESLSDLDAQLVDRGAHLVVRRGDLAREVAAVMAEAGAQRVHIAADASGYAARRESALHEALDESGGELVVHEDSLFVVPPGRVRATGKDHMTVFTPYFRRWAQQPRRTPLPAPHAIRVPGLKPGTVPTAADLCSGPTAPDRARGGETRGRTLMQHFVVSEAAGYGGVGHDDLAGDRTSRLSPYLHFGCISPLELVTRAAASEEFVRQVAWRDFHHQVLAAHPDVTRTDFRPRGDRWRHSPHEFDAWANGQTGLPLVDAGMRQLLREGWMHNRARLVVGHFLTKTLYLDWRLGAQHFIDHLTDGDTANNTMNWQWVAGTGTDSRFNRTYNVTAQALRHDPTGDYVRRYVPELAGLKGIQVHEPWRLSRPERAELDYPEPIVDVQEGNARFLAARGK
jgi:deoxyribodipyrimidine photo-lyase